MNNTYGDLLYRPTTGTSAVPRPNIMDHIQVEKIRIPDNLGDGHPDPVGELGTPGSAGISYSPLRGEVGWICPVCGRGLAPSTSYCPCHLNNHSNIVYNEGLSLNDYISTTSTPPEAYYDTKVTSKVN